MLVTWIKSESEKSEKRLSGGIDTMETSNYRFIPLSYCVQSYSKINYSPKSAWADKFLASAFDKNLVSFDNAQALDEFLINGNEPGIEFDDSLKVITEFIRSNFNLIDFDDSRIQLNHQMYSVTS